MAPMSLLAGKEWRCRHREQTVDTTGEERVGQTEKVTLTHAHYHLKQPASERLLYSTGSAAWPSVMTEMDGMK